uniref:Smoothelin, like n=1 Tax=Neolamprologus brichardi TaxID=32507 RepID=A0A3Q4I8Z0_NEOBR
MGDMGEVCCPRSCSPEGETVCAALARYENTLRDAIREIHVDVSTFKLGMERRLEETNNLSGPLGRAVVHLQQENRQLRNQLDSLTRQVELLSGITCDRNTFNQTIPASPPATFSSSSTSSSPPAGSRVSSMVTSPVSGSSPSITRFSSRATFAVSNKTNSIEREEPIEVDPAPTHSGQENGHAVSKEHSVLLHGNICPPTDSPHEHAPIVTMRMPHLPITATTKTAEIKSSPIVPSSPASPLTSLASSEASPGSQPASSTTLPEPIEESPIQPAAPSVKSWTPTPIRALGSPYLQEKANSVPAKSVTYSVSFAFDGSFEQMGERRRELVRSQTLPRNIGAQGRRAIFERLDSEASRLKPVESKPKLKRSQSFGVSTASSIKQILLEWCRSKTIGYQNIDIQNFSSSWSDGMAFCALVHSFFPTEFDYTSLSPANRRHNFELAFGTAETKAGCDRLIEVDDMMIMGRKPDPMCVFTYVQSLYNHLRKFE